MFFDAQEVSAADRLHFDVCIIGAGVAGITLASHLDRSGFKVALLESGGLKADREVQSLYQGKNIGLPYYPLDTARSRQFGGSTNRWLLELGDGSIGARLFPLDALDFEKRDWVPNSGWPFDLAHLNPYYKRAAEFLELSPRGFSADAWTSSAVGACFPFIDDEVYTKIYQCVRRELFIKQCRDRLKVSENVSVYLNANVLAIETDATGEKVSSLRLSTLHRKRLSVTGEVVILAAGAIESARLLLLSNSHHSAGLGNQYDLVGRFFMEHPHLWEGTFIPNQHDLMRHKQFYKTHISDDGYPIIGQISVRQDLQRSHKLLNHAVVMKASPKPLTPLKYPVSGGIAAIKGALRAASKGELEHASRLLSTVVPVAGELSIRLFRRIMKMSQKVVNLRRDRVYQINHMSEQVPNPNSRVMLGQETDKFGQRRVELDWQLTTQDIVSIRNNLQIFDRKFQEAKLGKVTFKLDGTKPPESIHGGWHHMGTTRMHDSPKSGVTDRNGRVHGISNLYVAGSSTFPTSGSANPTFTIVALAIRLADELKRKAAAGEVTI